MTTFLNCEVQYVFNKNKIRYDKNKYRFHGAIESAESDGRTRKLWRIDELGGEKYLLILSEKELDFSNVSDQFGAERPQTKCYDTLLDRVKNSSKWQFRLKANPVIHKKDTKSHRGRPV